MEVSLIILKNESFPNTEDVFSEAFSIKALNWFLFICYLLGLISCGLLVIVSWFEKSGQAGPFRTLANQLVSHQLDQTVMFYVVGFGPYAVRAIFGPMPGIWCKVGALGQQFFGMNICLISMSIGWTRTIIAYFFKTIPVMDDKFFATFIVIAINLLTFMANLAKNVVEERRMIITEVLVFVYSSLIY